MGEILLFSRPEKSFDPEATAALGAAYEKAASQLRGDGFTEFVRRVLAQRIIAAAATGERDPDRLCTSAFSALGFPE
jgi:hypothetical protein